MGDDADEGTGLYGLRHCGWHPPWEFGMQNEQTDEAAFWFENHQQNQTQPGLWLSDMRF